MVSQDPYLFNASILDNLRWVKKNIEKNIKTIFKNSNNAFLVYVNFPRKNARANTITLIAKDDFF